MNDLTHFLVLVVICCFLAVFSIEVAESHDELYREDIGFNAYAPTYLVQLEVYRKGGIR